MGRFVMPEVTKLVVAPHCDDETLGCGGLLAKHGPECAVVVLAEPDDVRAKEFNAAKEILGFPEAHFLGLQDGYVGADMHRLVGLLDRVLAQLRPQELYLPYPSSHQDHIAGYEAGVRSGRLSMSEGHHFTPSVFVYDVVAYDINLYPTELRWNDFVALSEEQIDRKVEALRAYTSQGMVGPHPVNGLKQSAHAIGIARQVAWAEQYAVVRRVRA